MKSKYILIYTIFFLVVASLSVFAFKSLSPKETQQIEEPRVAVQTNYEKLPKADESEMHDEVHGDLHNTIETSVAFGDSSIKVTNGEDTDLTNCTLELNQTIVQRGYMYTQDLLPANDTVTLNLSLFTRDGVAFDPTFKKAQNIMIMCANGWSYLSNR